MIKGIILDVDGVIIGEKIGFNSPYPHPEVLKALKFIRQKGIFISLCTAKPHFAIDKIIKDAQLDNYHISDGGGVIINPITNKIVKQHLIDSKIASIVIKTFIKQSVYIEYYTVNDYVIQKDQVSKITKDHQHVLQKPPQVVKSLSESALLAKVTKLMPIAKNEDDRKNLEKIFEPFNDKLTLSWGVHPVILPLQFGIITAPGISKKEGAKDISESTKVPFKNILGVGDSLSDWQFIEMCQYGAAMGNAKQELIDLVQSKGSNGFIGPSVDKNGILKILQHFKLIK
ncbi:HAD hydrolase family protein [Patescibacteria group bacterium]